MRLSKRRYLGLLATALALLAGMVFWPGLLTVHAQQEPPDVLAVNAVVEGQIGNTGAANGTHAKVRGIDAGFQPIAAQDQQLGEQIRRCIQNTLGRLPSSPQDMNQQERTKISQACPESEGRLGALFFGSTPDSDEAILQQLRDIEVSLGRLESETELEIQQEMDRMSREREEQERRMREDLQRELAQIDQQASDLEADFEVTAQRKGWDARKRAEKGQELRRLLANLEQERFKLEQRMENQIQRDINLMERDGVTRERELLDEMNRARARLEGRRTELEEQMESLRTGQAESQQVVLDRERLERERQVEEARLKQQQQLDQQRFDQQRQSIELERQLAEDRLRQQQELDQQRIDQDRQRLERDRLIDLERQRLQSGRSSQDVVLQNPEPGPAGVVKLPAPSDKLPTRGFFTNSVSGEINDIEKLMDPTTLAVLGILLTLVATSLSLIKGS